MNVNRAGNGRRSCLNLLRNVLILRIVADDLNIDRCRQPEIQYLGYDVRRLKEEDHIGISRGQFIAQRFDILLGSTMLGLKRDQTLTISRSDCRRASKRKIEERRQSDVVEHG